MSEDLESKPCAVCKENDFLPLQCVVCLKFFCRQHLSSHGDEACLAGGKEDRVVTDTSTVKTGITLDDLVESTLQREMAEKKQLLNMQQQQHQHQQNNARHAVLTTAELPPGLHRARRLQFGSSTAQLHPEHSTVVFFWLGGLASSSSSLSSLLLRPCWIDIRSPTSASVGAVVDYAAATFLRYLGASASCLSSKEPAAQLSVAAQIQWLIGADGATRSCSSLAQLQDVIIKQMKASAASSTASAAVKVFSLAPSGSQPQQQRECVAMDMSQSLSTVLAKGGACSVLVVTVESLSVSSAADSKASLDASATVPAVGSISAASVATVMTPFWRKNLLWLMLAPQKAAPARRENQRDEEEKSSMEQAAAAAANNHKNQNDDDVPPPPLPRPPPSSSQAATSSAVPGAPDCPFLTSVPWSPTTSAAKPLLVGIAPTTPVASTLMLVCFMLGPDGCLAPDGKGWTLKVNSAWIVGRLLDAMCDRATRPAGFFPPSMQKISADRFRLFHLLRADGSPLDLTLDLAAQGVTSGAAIAVGGLADGAVVSPDLIREARAFEDARVAKKIPRPLQVRTVQQCILQ